MVYFRWDLVSDYGGGLSFPANREGELALE